MDDSLLELAAEFDEEFDNKLAQIEINPNSSSKPSSITKVALKTHYLLVNPKQKGNPLLKSITSVPWEYDDILPDYQMGVNSCALFLSVRYHNLNPDYIHERLKLLGKMYELRVLLVQVDVKDAQHQIKNLTRICILADMTLLLAWSPEEAGKLIEMYKIYENKPADKIMEKSEDSVYLQLIQALTSIKSVNSTDAMNLLAKFKTIEGIVNASENQLAECPGLGLKKAKNIFTTLHEPFKK